MSEQELNEAIEYNLEYMEAMQSEEIFGGDYTSSVELKYAEKTIDRLQQIIDKAIELIEKYGLVDKTGNFNAYLDTIELKEVLKILKGDPNDKTNKENN